VYKQTSSPLIISKSGKVRSINRLPRTHQDFDENFLQELLVNYPKILPVNRLRDDVGDLLCIGREVAAGNSGYIDNLYISSGGYPIVVETKLWRNPQARREVLSQVLDYTKELTSKDFEWFEQIWQEFSRSRYEKQESLIEKLSNCIEEEIDQQLFVDRLNRALRRGDILSLIVGDGIETRLQELISHLCRDSAHLRYSIALIELACYRMDDDSFSSEMLVVPRIIQDVEPVQRAYVRVELSPEIEEKLIIKSVASSENNSPPGYVRTILSEEEFLNELDKCVDPSIRGKVEQFYNNLCVEMDLEKDFKSAAMIIKVPDPSGEKPGASLLSIERQGRIYNNKYLKGQLLKWGLPPDKVESITSDFWTELNKIDRRFLKDGIRHIAQKQFLPLKDLESKLEDIGKTVAKAVRHIRDLSDTTS
jgi:hypothetical protein